MEVSPTSTASAAASKEQASNVQSLKSTMGQRLDPYLALAKSAKGAGCVQLIKDVLAAPGVLVFAELLHMPHVAELEHNPDHRKYHTLLKIFSYGTYQDYTQHKDTLPELTPAQRTKLQQLSIVTLAERARALPYADLLQYLEIENVRQLEDLIMDSIYQDVIKASLDQKQKLVEVHSAMGRDLRPGQSAQMIKVLEEWTRTSESLLASLDGKIQEVLENSAKEKQAQLQFVEKREKVRKEFSGKGGRSGMDRYGGGMQGGRMEGGNYMDYVPDQAFVSPEFLEERDRTYGRGGMGSSSKRGKRVPRRQ